MVKRTRRNARRLVAALVVFLATAVGGSALAHRLQHPVPAVHVP